MLWMWTGWDLELLLSWSTTSERMGHMALARSGDLGLATSDS